MGLFSTLKQYVGVQAEDAGSTAHSLLAKMDGEGYSEAIIRDMEAEHMRAATELATVRQDYEREQKEADDAKAEYERLVAKAGELQDDPAQAEKFNKLVSIIQSKKVKVQTEIREAEAAKSLLDAVQNEVDDFAEALRGARANMQAAQADNKLAEVELRAAEREAEIAKRKNGSSRRLDTLSNGLKAFNEDAAKNKARAEALKAQAALNAGSKEDEDFLSDILAEPVASKSNADKLADLAL